MDIGNEFYDVVIIGSGPAGVAAAITATRSGLKVLLVTAANDSAEVLQEKYDETPLESLHPGVAIILEQLDLQEVLEIAAKGHYTGIAVNGLYSPLSTVPGETWTGVHLSRPLFDHYLLSCVKKSPAAVRVNTKVSDIRHVGGAVVTVFLKSGEKITCSYLIDCSGQRRIIGKRLGLKEGLLSPPLICSTEVIQMETDQPLTAHFTASGSGWTWLAAGENGHCTQTKVSIKNNGGNLKRPEVRLANVRWRIFKPLAAPGYILAGDAAGILDPAAGQGILIALMSGIMAAETVIKCKRRPATTGWHLTHYHRWFTELFEAKCDALKAEYLKLGIIFCAMFIAAIY